MLRRCGVAFALLITTLVPTEARAESSWLLWIETTEWAEPTDTRGILSGEGFRGKKSWEQEQAVYEARESCELELPKQISAHVAKYRAMGFTVVRDDEDGPARFVRSGLAGSRWCSERPCVIAGSSGRSNPDGRERLTHHTLYCLPDTIDPRGPKGGSR